MLFTVSARSIGKEKRLASVAVLTNQANVSWSSSSALSNVERRTFLAKHKRWASHVRPPREPRTASIYFRSAQHIEQISWTGLPYKCTT